MSHTTTRGSITYAQLRAEGVREIGRIQSIVFCVTSRGLRLFHADAIPHRPFDAYAIELATNMLDWGHSSVDVANGMGVTESHLVAELKRAGYRYGERVNDVRKRRWTARVA